MNQLDKVAGRPAMVNIKGKEYKLSILSINDFADFEKMVRQERLQKTVNSLQEAGVDAKAIAEAAQSIMAKELPFAELQLMMNSVTGVRYLLWCAMKQNHNIKLEEVGEVVDLNNLPEIIEVIDSLGGEAAEKAKNLVKRKAK